MDFHVTIKCPSSESSTMLLMHVHTIFCSQAAVLLVRSLTTQTVWSTSLCASSHDLFLIIGTMVNSGNQEPSGAKPLHAGEQLKQRGSMMTLYTSALVSKPEQM